MSRDRGPSGVTRRAAIGSLAVGAALAPIAAAGADDRIEAIAFDGFPIFDPRSVNAALVARYPDRGTALAQAWSTKLFGYTWLYTAARQYAGFEEVADRSLAYAAESLGLSLGASDRAALVGAYSRLNLWPDVLPALAKLRGAGIRLAFLSNLSDAMLRTNMARTGITDAFEHVLSTDRVRQFKPSPAAYAMAIDAFGLPRHRIGFAAFGGWDAAGAAWFGYRTCWVNRLGVPRERIEPGPAIVAPDMSAVLRLAGLG